MNKSTETRAATLTVRQLFTDDQAYRVPVYQRNYAWGEEQIHQLLNDVLDAATDNSEHYFLGNLVTVQPNASSAEYDVIDGQQRLTTLFILLNRLHLRFGDTYPSPAPALSYAARRHATETLRSLRGGTRHDASSSRDEDMGMVNAARIIDQFLGQAGAAHSEAPSGFASTEVASFLLDHVMVVRTDLPRGTHVNRYFEVMNTRGEQLEQVDIIKARLMAQLDQQDGSCFAWLWDACRDMNRYVQMALTPGDQDLRTKLFGTFWDWPSFNSFDELRDVWVSEVAHATDETRASAAHGLTLAQALQVHAASTEPTRVGDDYDLASTATISFTSLLLHARRLWGESMNLAAPGIDADGTLVDNKLLELFDIEREWSPDPQKREALVKSFAFALAKAKFLFDSTLLRRSDKHEGSGQGEWVLQRLHRSSKPTKRHGRSYSPQMSSTFRSASSGDAWSVGARVLLLQSALRVTYTSPRSMHWITEVLREVWDAASFTDIDPERLLRRLERLAGGAVYEQYFNVLERPSGFDIPRIVFTYLDYLLVTSERRSDFAFTFRNSIEHFYPQHPDKEHLRSALVSTVTEQTKNELGNLALLTVAENSKFTNALPLMKATYTELVRGNPKLSKMVDLLQESGGTWAAEQINRHGADMEAVLTKRVMDLGIPDSDSTV